MSQYIDESTHIQMANAIKDLASIINAMGDRGTRVTWDEGARVSKALELRQVALVQLKRAGVMIETPNEIKA
jgi:hypothetical protein